MKLSIILPTFNRYKSLERTLLSLVSSSVSISMYEIIIVDNGSTDHTFEVVKKVQQAYPDLNINYYYDSIPGLLTGRHRGAQEAKGDILTFIDDDIVVSNQWLNTIIEVMTTRLDISLLTGPCIPQYESHPPEWLRYFWTQTQNGDNTCGWLSLLDMGNTPKEIDPNYVWGLNFTIRKKDFYELGGFHPDNIPSDYQIFQGDGETGLTLKAKKNAKKAFYHPGVLLHHQIPNSRLTYEYFDKRAYYQGVCNSYTFLRKKDKQSVTEEIPKKRKHLAHRLFVYAKRYVRIHSHVGKQSIPKEIEALKRRFNTKEQEGFAFHQHAFKTNPTVRKWVLQENYFDYNLPELS